MGTDNHTARNIVMWSGPRNISTAMMYAFASRDDCQVWDEPFYAWYLKTTGLDHPMSNEVIAEGITDADEVIRRCITTPEKLHYQKHMTQHMLKGLDRSWLDQVTNAFLIRRPDKVLVSYSQKRETVNLQDIGYIEQLEIFNQIADQTGTVPPVTDADKFLADPQQGLEKLCSALNIPYQKSMLKWSPGPKSYDGIWSSHWYNAAHRTTGFATPTEREVNLSPALQKVADQARPIYDQLYRYAL